MADAPQRGLQFYRILQEGLLVREVDAARGVSLAALIACFSTLHANFLSQTAVLLPKINGPFVRVPGAPRNAAIEEHALARHPPRFCDSSII